MNVQWTMPDGTIAQNVTLPFTFDKQWFDNRRNNAKDNDSAFYSGGFSSPDEAEKNDRTDSERAR